ncbi:cytochrome p450 monooxygenase [Pseudozyma flocculosa PF-1]|uniref:Probable Cytochrome P450 monooxygenase involved in Ustilagic Acid production n=1 Tax=Pseudozyma flocculosa TaxID=84751 RepID=A0A5C3EW11_9BASI|nr:cytochrome p450 monooxygenase [Pseudozyma flocculosa PF-1]EPQ31815.1 cytochrome p450 monooxygenase [Pseudozyma flocculosa PF-1]SPO35291.1 probable Cytochrome P450 monooxygenase involved in Ustilagic Acid production [Pseudozyma flocculosa]
MNGTTLYTGEVALSTSSWSARTLLFNAFLSCIAYAVILGIKSKYFHVTSSIPGPSLLHWTMLPALYYYIRGEQWKYVDHLHTVYGPIFRLGSRQIYVSDKEAIKQLLAKENQPKVNWYAALSRDPKTAGMFTTTNKEYHRQRRRLMSPAFAVEYLKNLEPFLHNATTKLFEAYQTRTEKAAKEGRELQINVYEDLACLAMDILGETAFGTSFNLVACLDDPKADRRFVEINRLLAKYLHDGGVRFFCRPFDKYMKRDLNVYKLTNPLVEERFAEKRAAQEKDADGSEERKDILQFLVNASVEVQKGQKDKLTEIQVKDQCVELLIAGGETTSNTITYILKALLENPDKLEKLYETIPSAPLDSTVAGFEELRDTPYLDACINEGMRMYPVTNELGRRTARESTVVLGHVIPPRTAISASLRALHYSPSYWPQPHKFWPERFLDGNTEGAPPADMAAFMPFGTGPRNCIGWKFAWHEMKMVLHTLLSRYHVYAVEKDVDFRQFVTFQLAKPRFRIGLKPREPVAASA